MTTATMRLLTAFLIFCALTASAIAASPQGATSPRFAILRHSPSTAPSKHHRWRKSSTTPTHQRHRRRDARTRTRRKRVYYIGIDEVQWNYYPAHATPSQNGGPKGNLCHDEKFEESQLLFVGDGKRVDGTGNHTFLPSSTYSKTLFREYTDSSFKTVKRRTKDENHLGLLGPVLRVEVGEVLVVVIRGLPKGSAGNENFGFNVDGLPGIRKSRVVGPGKTATFWYNVDSRSGPRKHAYINSHMLLYSGTVGNQPDNGAGIYKGLLGAVIVYKKGVLGFNGKPKSVHNELVTILWVGNENVGDEEGDEEESNLMHSINGMVYCSLPDLTLAAGKTTRWYTGGVGNEVDVHSLHFHGIVGMGEGGEHRDVVRLMPGTTAALDFIPDNVGTWFLHCHINDHINAGMGALFRVTGDASDSVLRPGARSREYFVQAEDAIWDYAPLGSNVCDSAPFGEDETIFVKEHFSTGPGFGIGSKYMKSRYIQYTNASFTTRVKPQEDMQHLGFMGPVLRARVGEKLVVHFKNKASVPTSLHPHGVFYTKQSEGAPYNDGTSGADKKDDAVKPGGTHTYVWEVPDRAGPGPGEDKESKLWIYHSHHSEVEDSYAGLFGIILIINSGALFHDDTLLPIGGTREVFLHFSVMNEGQSFHIRANARRDAGNRALASEQFEELLENEEFVESNLMHSINGYVYCNGPLLKLRQGQRTRFYMYSLGSEVDLHTPMIANEVLSFDEGASRGSGGLLAGMFSSASVVSRSTGMQELRCGTADHITAGMRTLFFVEGNDSAGSKTSPPIENAHVAHYIAAEEIDWDYAALGKHGCTGEAFGEEEDVFTQPGPLTPGSRYVKAVYREYNDSSFNLSKRCIKPGEDGMHFSGVAGPLLHFQVGEIVRIVFRNKLHFTANINFAGLELLHSSNESLGVPPGGQVTYLLKVGEEAGPSRWDLSAVPYVYYSSVDSIAHTNAGLTGVIAVTRRNGLRHRSRLPKGTTAAYPLMLNIFRENGSPLIDKSLAKHAMNPRRINNTVLEQLNEDEDWLESNAMHSINGYLYGNNPVLRGRSGSTVRFYVFGYGSEASMHAPLWKGQVIGNMVRRGAGSSGIQILPYNAETMDVILKTRGLWSIVCGVSDHVAGGMTVCTRVY